MARGQLTPLVRAGLSKLLQRYLDETKVGKSIVGVDPLVRARARLAKDMGLEPSILADLMPNERRVVQKRKRFRAFSWGRELPEALAMKIKAAVYRFEDVPMRLRWSKIAITELAWALPPGAAEVMTAKLSEVEAEFNRHKWFAMCPYCKAMEVECNRCGNVRAVTEEVFRAAPEELTADESSVFLVGEEVRSYPRG
jgi:hypothetical protein